MQAYSIGPTGPTIGSILQAKYNFFSQSKKKLPIGSTYEKLSIGTGESRNNMKTMRLDILGFIVDEMIVDFRFMNVYHASSPKYRK